MSLRLTPKRLRLLEQVRDGQLFRYGDGQDYDAIQYRVTARMAEMRRAGWVELADGPDTMAVATSRWYAHKTPWVLTGKGREVLAKAKARDVRP